MRKKRSTIVILKPKLTVLPCCYVWGYPRPRDIIKWSAK